ncbi:hypothetical protein QFZ98_001654 [Paraburkholderia youngii]
MVLLDHVVEMFGLADLDGNFTTLAYPLSLRDREEMMAGRGVSVEHSTLHRWAIKLLPVLEEAFRLRKRICEGWTGPVN